LTEASKLIVASLIIESLPCMEPIIVFTNSLYWTLSWIMWTEHTSSNSISLNLILILPSNFTLVVFQVFSFLYDFH
jgi:hypothetical protein